MVNCIYIPPADDAARAVIDQEIGAAFFQLDGECKAIVARMTRDKILLGGKLTTIEQRALWVAGSHDSFEAYLVTLSLSRSAAFSYMAAARVADRLEQPAQDGGPPIATPAEVDRIGVSNLAQMAPLLPDLRDDPQAAGELVEQARELTTTDFKREVRARKGQPFTQRAEFLEEVALTLRDLSGALVTSPDADQTLQQIERRAGDARKVLAAIAQAPTDD